MRVSFEISRGEQVEKAGETRPPGTTSRPLDVLAAQLTSDAAANGTPPNPGPVPPSTGEPLPVRWPFQYASNQLLTPRGEDRRLTPFAQLRVLADVCDIVRIAIEARKDQMTALTWDFAPRKRSASRTATPGERATIERLRQFFRKPDRAHGWNTWVRMLVEEILVIDALSIFKRPTRAGDLYALEIIDGTTIKPLLDARGFVPAPPAAAYRQVIQGQAVKGGDCSVEQLLYRPRTVRTWTPYGLSATECVMLTVNTALNRQVFNLGYYSEGNIPEGLISTPEGWTTDQIRQFQEYWDTLIAGNYKTRQRLRFVGPKMAESVHQFKKESFDTKFDEWLLQVVCAAFGVQPQELGFTHNVNRAQGEQQENITYRRGVKPLAGFIKDILDEVVADHLDAADFEAIFTGGESEDRLAQAKIDEIYWRIGKTSTDELRQRDGDEQIGLGPVVMTAKGPMFVEQLVRSKDLDPTSSAVRELETDETQDPGPEARARTAPRAPEAEDDVEAEADATKAADAELGAFRRYLLNRVTKGRGIDQAATAFESSVLPVSLRTDIVRAILVRKDSAQRDVVTPADVVETFATVEKAATPKRLQLRSTVRYQRFLSGYFGDLAEALSAHMDRAAREL